MKRFRMPLLGLMVTLVALAGRGHADARTLPCGAQCLQNEQACERICNFNPTFSCDITCQTTYAACLDRCSQ
jgi:hypothetical protein